MNKQLIIFAIIAVYLISGIEAIRVPITNKNNNNASSASSAKNINAETSTPIARTSPTAAKVTTPVSKTSTTPIKTTTPAATTSTTPTKTTTPTLRTSTPVSTASNIPVKTTNFTLKTSTPVATTITAAAKTTTPVNKTSTTPIKTTTPVATNSTNSSSSTSLKNTTAASKSNQTSTSTSTNISSNPSSSTSTSSNNSTSSTADSDNSTFIADCLSGQNPFRQELALDDLFWSDDIAVGAQEWAQIMADQQEMYHSGTAVYGENIAYGTTSFYGVAGLIKMWTDEKQSFIEGAKFPYCTTGGVVGHYTQIVWRDTTQVGCGIAENNGVSYICCRYSQPGNWVGEDVY